MPPDIPNRWISKLNGKCDGNTFTWYWDLSRAYIVSGSLLLGALLLPSFVVAIYLCWHRERILPEKQEESDGPSENEKEQWEEDAQYMQNVYSALKPTTFLDGLLANNVSETHISKRAPVGFRADAEVQTDPVYIYEEQSTMGSSWVAMDNSLKNIEERGSAGPIEIDTTQMMTTTKEKCKSYTTGKTDTKLTLWKANSREHAKSQHSKDKTWHGMNTDRTAPTQRPETRSTTARLPMAIPSNPALLENTVHSPLISTKSTDLSSVAAKAVLNSKDKVKPKAKTEKSSKVVKKKEVAKSIEKSSNMAKKSKEKTKEKHK